jgi:hypothetical protein
MHHPSRARQDVLAAPAARQNQAADGSVALQLGGRDGQTL